MSSVYMDSKGVSISLILKRPPNPELTGCSAALVLSADDVMYVAHVTGSQSLPQRLCLHVWHVTSGQ